MKREMVYGCIPFMRTRERELVVLMVHNVKGHWEFPKGHREGRETDEEVALREMQEETGLVGEIQHEAPLVMNYTFMQDDTPHKKEVMYYFCRVPDGSPVTIQESEVDEYEWLPLENVSERATFPEMKSVAQKVYCVLAD